MLIVLSLMFIQGILGATDTFWYHEWKARLPARLPASRSELQLHAVRDFIYALLFASLPWMSWNGIFAWVLFALIMAEVGITIADFIIEDDVRSPMGGIAPGERAMHTVMAIIYGAMLGHFFPILWTWSQQDTGFVAVNYLEQGLPKWMAILLSLMGVGVFLSGLRDLWSSKGGSCWPWPREEMHIPSQN